VRLARLDLVSVLEGGAAVRRPCHLPNAWVSSDSLDAQAWLEKTRAKTRDKEIQRSLPCRDLRCRKVLEVA
jgi:hypothetical protein